MPRYNRRKWEPIDKSKVLNSIDEIDFDHPDIRASLARTIAVILSFPDRSKEAKLKKEVQKIITGDYYYE